MSSPHPKFFGGDRPPCPPLDYARALRPRNVGRDVTEHLETGPSSTYVIMPNLVVLCETLQAYRTYTEIRRTMGPSRSACQGHSRPSEPTRIDRLRLDTSEPQ